MRMFESSTIVQGAFASAVPIAAAAWLVTVPTILTASSFVALLGVIAAFGWVAKTTYLNAQPAPSVAQQVHDAHHLTSPTHARRRK